MKTGTCIGGPRDGKELSGMTTVKWFHSAAGEVIGAYWFRSGTWFWDKDSRPQED